MIAESILSGIMSARHTYVLSVVLCDPAFQKMAYAAAIDAVDATVPFAF